LQRAATAAASGGCRATGNKLTKEPSELPAGDKLSFVQYLRERPADGHSPVRLLVRSTDGAVVLYYFWLVIWRSLPALTLWQAQINKALPPPPPLLDKKDGLEMNKRGEISVYSEQSAI
jgi:hypothetical protein